MVKFTSKLKFFLPEPGTSFLCAVVAVVVILCVVYRNYCFFLVSLFFFFFVLVASCTWGSTYYRPGPLVQPLLSEIKLFQFKIISPAQGVRKGRQKCTDGSPNYLLWWFYR